MATSFDSEHIDAVLGASDLSTRIALGPRLWGFGGVHGGLVLALLASAMRPRAQGRTLRMISGQFKRSLRDEFEIELNDEGSGRTVSWLSAVARANGSAAAVARAVFAAPGSIEARPASLPKPLAPPPTDCPRFTVPAALVPFARRTEIRPVGSARPFGGAREPELLAWLRLVDDDLPPNDARLIVLMDSLAPSYAAVLDAPATLPTVAYSATPGAGLASTNSPWLLLRARTDIASQDGWVFERLDAWGPDGQYLGAGEQLRLLATEIGTEPAISARS